MARLIRGAPRIDSLHILKSIGMPAMITQLKRLMLPGEMLSQWHCLCGL